MSKMSIIQHTYTPKFIEYTHTLKFIEYTKTLVLDDLFETESCAEYALQHNFNVLLTNTTSTSTGQAIAVFLRAGFKIELRESDCIAPDGTRLPPDTYFLFNRPKC